MPATKRKNPAKAPTSANKKVRTEDTSIVNEPEEAPSGRPKRKSLGTPQYNFTRSHQRTKNQANTVAKVEKTIVPDPELPKRRGRPPKDATTKASVPEPASTARKAGRGRPKMTSAAKRKDVSQSGSEIVEEESSGKKRGRPRKSDATETAKPVSSKKAATTKKQSSAKATKAASKAATKSTSLPKKRGRPSKTIQAQTTTSRSDTNHKVEADADLLNSQAFDAEQGEHQYWLLKAEPNDRFENGVNVKFSIDDLHAANAPEPWDGVRNYGARNNMRAMRKNDLAFFYHSNCPVPGIVGVMRIVQEHSPDQSAFDPNHPYYDPKSSPSNPKWDCVHVEFVKKFDAQITLKTMQENRDGSGELANMQLLRMSRLSVSAVSPKEWRFILSMAGEDDHLGEGEEGPAEEMAGYESDTDGEVDGGPKEELNGVISTANGAGSDLHQEVEEEDGGKEEEEAPEAVDDVTDEVKDEAGELAA